jgi:hypothetical protein
MLPQVLQNLLDEYSFCTVGDACTAGTSLPTVPRELQPAVRRLDRELRQKGYTFADLSLIPYLALKQECRNPSAFVPDLSWAQLSAAVPAQAAALLKSFFPEFLYFRFAVGPGAVSGKRWGDRVTKLVGWLKAPVAGYLSVSYLSQILPHVEDFLLFRRAVGGAPGTQWGDRVVTSTGTLAAPFGYGSLSCFHLAALLPHTSQFVTFRDAVGPDTPGKRWGDRANYSLGCLTSPFGNGGLSLYNLAKLMPHVVQFIKFRDAVGPPERGTRWGDRATTSANTLTAPAGDSDLSVAALVKKLLDTRPNQSTAE